MDVSMVHFSKPLDEDNWSTIEDAATRKKVQNRLAQRVHRMKFGRKKKGKELPTNKQSRVSNNFEKSPGFSSTSVTENALEIDELLFNQVVQLDDMNLSFLEDPDENSLFPFESIPQYVPLSSINPVSKEITPAYQLKPTKPITSNPYPLPFADTYFMTLHCMNTISAMLVNSRILNIQCSPPPKEAMIHIPPNFTTPPSLAPTNLQYVQPHVPYLALIPFSSLRDNLLKAAGIIVPQDIWNDFATGEVKVWGNTPWEKTGWEVGEVFARKWWFLMSEDVILQANFWRAGRGESQLSLSGIRSRL